jgi:hypothetical protein
MRPDTILLGRSIAFSIAMTAPQPQSCGRKRGYRKVSREIFQKLTTISHALGAAHHAASNRQYVTSVV